jgi:hypothetical protein
MPTFREDVTKVAHDVPETRVHLVPLLSKHADGQASDVINDYLTWFAQRVAAVAVQRTHYADSKPMSSHGFGDATHEFTAPDGVSYQLNIEINPVGGIKGLKWQVINQKWAIPAKGEIPWQELRAMRIFGVAATIDEAITAALGRA